MAVNGRNGPTYDYGLTPRNSEQSTKAHPCRLLRLIRGGPEEENINYSRLASEDPTNQSTSPT
jgi:hypothetical protein